jgi:hypothetical protein
MFFTLYATTCQENTYSPAGINSFEIFGKWIHFIESGNQSPVAPQKIKESVLIRLLVLKAYIPAGMTGFVSLFKKVNLVSGLQDTFGQ